MINLFLFFVLLLSSPCFAGLNIVLLGPPGSGKGTLATQLKNHYQIPHLSTGDIVRQQIATGTDFGLKVKQLTATGQLLPDTPEYIGELVRIISEELQKPEYHKGFILDGFPRTEFQVQELNKLLRNLGKRIDAAVLIEVKNETVIERLGLRLTCKDCRRTYSKNIYKPKVQNQCDDCHGELIVREDDSADVVLNRLQIYERQIRPIADFFSDLQQLYRFNGESNADSEFLKLTQFLDQPYPRAYLQGRIPTYPHPKNSNIRMYNLIEMYKDAGLIQHIVDRISEEVKNLNPDFVASPEARALPLFGAIAYKTGKPGIVIRKAGKIPEGVPKFSQSYSTAYSTEQIEMTVDPSLRGKTVVVVDDGISSAGTTVATVRLLEQAGLNVLHVYGAIRYHYTTPCQEFLTSGIRDRTTTFLDLN